MEGFKVVAAIQTLCFLLCLPYIQMAVMTGKPSTACATIFLPGIDIT